MPLESATYIDGLNASNPVGSTDKVQTLDDHVRLIKSAIKATLPNLTGAVTATHTELNYVDGVTSAIQTQLDLKATATALNASNLTSGTVPDARFPATLPAMSGVNLTALNGTNIASGTVADARLSSNIPKKDAANTFTVGNFFGSGLHNEYGTTPMLGVAAAGAAAIVARDSTNNVEGFLVAGTATVQLGSYTNHAVDMYANNALHTKLNVGGSITPSNASAAAFGYQGAPLNAQADNYTLVLTDAGKAIQCGGAGKTITIPANSSVAFPIGTVITIVMYGPSSTTANIAITTDTMYFAGTNYSVTGTRTLAAGGIATLIKNDATNWTITGIGLT